MSTTTQVNCTISNELHKQMEKNKKEKNLKINDLVPLLIEEWVLKQQLNEIASKIK